MATANSKGLQALLEQSGTTYPQVVNLTGKVNHKINAVIKETADQAIPSYNPGTPVIEAQSGYITPLNQQGILSLRFQDYYYPEHAAHGVTGVSSVTLDLHTGYIYHLNDLFKKGSDYQARIYQIIQAQIISRQIQMLKPFAGVPANQEYYLTPDSLVIYYQPYIYTPGYYGVLEFKIPFSQIKATINPGGAD